MFSFCLPFFSPSPSPVLPVSLSHSSFYYPSLSFSPDLLSFTIPLFPFLSFVYPCSLSLYLAVCRSPLAPSYQSSFLLSSNHISSHLCLLDFPNHYHRSPPNHRNTKSTDLITNRNLYLHLYFLHLNTYSFHDSAPPTPGAARVSVSGDASSPGGEVLVGTQVFKGCNRWVRPKFIENQSIFTLKGKPKINECRAK